MATTFIVPPHLEQYNVPLSTFRASNPKFTYFVVGGLVFSHPPPSQQTTTTHPEPQILLLQRSHSDSYPGYWEGPGGLCESTDESILAGAAREVLEESGLHVSRFVDLVAVDEWQRIRPDEVAFVAKFTFLVEIEEQGASFGVVEEGKVRLEPEEHEAFVWAGEEEVRGVVERQEKGQREDEGGRGLRFVGVQGRNYLTAFRLVRGNLG